ncbi:hypothetical protein [Parafrankia soli]|uniref:hypothetical protein n=1 Tax=Parafrankia soli TaxID=2599596 RepID=UPI000A704183|nr:hypothetical protein [Parafrankia soli]
MSTLASSTGPARGRGHAAAWWFALSAVAIALFAPLPYLTTSLTALAEQDSDLALNYVDRPTPIQIAFYLHVAFGGLALLLSPVQLSARGEPEHPGCIGRPDGSRSAPSWSPGSREPCWRR